MKAKKTKCVIAHRHSILNLKNSKTKVAPTTFWLVLVTVLSNPINT
jgi:hypothetical protein